MKKIIPVLAVLFMISCENTVGPQGPPGPPGPVGPVGQAFEVVANFGPSNDYVQIFTFPENIVVLESDIVVVYLLWEVDPETDLDVWQPLPLSVFFSDGGELQYAFDHTVADVRLFLTGDINLDTIGPSFTLDQIFRVAILPVDYVQANNVNLKNMKEVMQAVNTEQIKRFKAEKLR